MNLFAISGLLLGITSIILGVFTLLKGRKGIHVQWVFFCIAMAIWGFGSYQIGIATSSSEAIFWWRVAYIGVIFIPVFYTHFLLNFIKKDKKIFLLILYITTLIFQFFNIFTDFFIKEVRFVFGQIYYISSPTLLYNLFVLMFFCLVLYQINILWKTYKTAKGITKFQIRAFLLISIIGYGGGFFDFLPVYNIDIYPIFNFAIVAFPFIIAYAIFRHNLFDIRVVIQRGIIYSFILSLVIGVYLTLIFLLGLFFREATNITILLAAGITTVLGIYGTPIIENYFRHWTDKIFFKDKYDYSQAVYELSEALNKNIKIEELVKEIIVKLKQIFRISKLIFILPLQNKYYYDRNKKLRKLSKKIPEFLIDEIGDNNDIFLTTQQIIKLEKIIRSDLIRAFSKRHNSFCEDRNDCLVIAIRLEKKVVGILMLGEKRSGDLYTQEDISLLRSFAYQAAVAIEKARLYEQVKAYSQNLEEKVRQRTAKIQGLQEAQKQMMLEISHGLQTPLTILKGELTLLRQRLPAEDKNLANFEKSIDRVSRLIYRLLHLARLDSDPHTRPKQKINFSNLLEELVEYFTVLMQDKDIKLEARVEKNIYIFARPKQIEELVTNLVSNAVKYMKDQGERKIKLILKKEGKWAKLIIQDTGRGIAPEHLPFLFEQFYRVQDKTQAAIQGTGLGLAICKKIVESHQGQIKAKSKLGQGTTFIVRLPLVD